MNDYVVYNIKNHILICRQHGYAIQCDGVGRHFRTFHKSTSLQTRNALTEYAKSLDLWDVDRVLNNHDGSFIEGLTVDNGYKCQYEVCQQLRGTVDSIRKHCNDAHSWTTLQEICWKKQAYQTIFNGLHLR